LRKAKEGERLPARKVERTEGESAFQRVRPIILRQGIETKPKLFSYVELSLSKERSGRLEEAE